MFKKLIAVSLVAALALPVSGAFANSARPDTQNAVDSSITVAQGGVHIMTTVWRVKTATNMRATPNGAYVISLYPSNDPNAQSDKLVGGHDYVVVNGVTWVPVESYYYGKSGYVPLSALEEIG
ncbi:hypothetical protein [Paenibacillus graminis]|nr:hypothetical protein [Paenibacillus graminis]MEC0171935.1 hypothetical protein [Paenibacillus graminis]